MCGLIRNYIELLNFFEEKENDSQKWVSGSHEIRPLFILTTTINHFYFEVKARNVYTSYCAFYSPLMQITNPSVKINKTRLEVMQ